MRIKKVFSLIIFAIFTVAALAQNNVKRVAILEPVDKAGTISYGIKILLRQSITYAITKTPGFEGYNRIDMAHMLSEHEFQRTGYVSDDQIKKLGEMTGAAYVLIAEVTNFDTEHIIILANLVNVETGQIENSSVPIISGTDPENMAKSCAHLAEILLNATTSTESYVFSRPAVHARQSVVTEKDYTETAFDVNMTMVWVAGGEFLMGCTGEQSDCREDEIPVRRVSVGDFYIGMYEVSQAQWMKIMGTSVSAQRELTSYHKIYGIGDNYPMYYVNWEEAMEFCRRLSKTTGKKYTLPTESQWEYAARGGITNEDTQYAGSNNINAVAWYAKNCFETHQCGEKEANALGLYDMSGNVSEWCEGWYADNTKRVSRGGSWEDPARSCRVSSRSSEIPNSRIYNIGFRVVCIP